MAALSAPFHRTSPDSRGSKALRLALLGSVAGFAFTAGSAPARAQYATPSLSPAALAGSSKPADPPVIAAQGAPPSPAPAGTPQPTDSALRQTVDDQGVTTLRRGTAKPPGISIAAGEGGSPDESILPTIAVQGQSSADYNMTQPTIPKLTESLLDTPQTIDVVTRGLMDDQGVTNFRDALRNVPGISIAAGEAGSQGDNLTIRGFTARNDIYLDGMRDFGSYYRDPFFLEDIQVLKGPASILFGKGSTGGVVEQDSKLPRLDSFVTGTAVFGTNNQQRLTADVNEVLPSSTWGDGAAIRLNAMVNQNQLADRDVGKNQRYGLAPTLAFGLGTPTRMYFTYLHQQEYDIPDYGLPWLYQASPTAGNVIAHPVPLSLTQSNYYGFSNGSNYLRTTADIPTFKAEHDVNNMVTLSDQFRDARYTRAFDITEPQFYTVPAALGATGTQALISPTTPLSSLLVSRNQLAGHSIEEFLENQADATIRFRTGDIEHTMRTGIEIGREISDPVRYSTIGPYSLTSLLSPNPNVPFNANTYLSSTTTTSAVTAAGYFLDTIKLNDQWELMGGLRYDRFTANYSQTVYANPVTGAGATAVSFHPLNYFLNWRAAIVYKPMPNGSIYADAGSSSDPSAEALSLSAATGALPPVENRSYEVGTKWELFDQRISFTAALFYTNQLNVSEPDPNNSLFNVLAGDAYATGGEFQAAGKITDNWQFLTGYAYTYGAIDKTTRTGPASDLDHRLANTPANTFNLWTTYKLPWQKLEVGGGINVVGSRYAATIPTTAGGVNFFKELPGYYTLQAMVKYPLTDQVAVQLNLTNLTDNKFYDQIHPAHVVPGGGRTALFTISYKL